MVKNSQTWSKSEKMAKRAKIGQKLSNMIKHGQK